MSWWSSAPNWQKIGIIGGGGVLALGGVYLYRQHQAAGNPTVLSPGSSGTTILGTSPGGLSGGAVGSSSTGTTGTTGTTSPSSPPAWNPLLPFTPFPSTGTGPLPPAAPSSPAPSAPSAASAYNSYVSGLEAAGASTIPSRYTGTAYKNLGPDPFSAGSIIVGKYLNGKFVTSYAQKLTQAPSFDTTGTIVGG